MKATVDIPDLVLRRAKAVAAERGITLGQLVIEAIEDKLNTATHQKPWMKHMGKLKHLRQERGQIGKDIAAIFEQIDEEVWR